MVRTVQYGGGIWSAECPLAECRGNVRTPKDMSVNDFMRGDTNLIGKCSQHGKVTLPFLCFDKK